MSKHQSDRKEDIWSAGQIDRVTDSRAAKEPALVILKINNCNAEKDIE